MIVVTVELWPHGQASKAEVLGRAEIFNDGTGDHWSGNYGARFFSEERIGKGNQPPFYPSEERKRVCRLGSVERFARLDKSVWHLIRAALNNALIVRRSRKKAA